MPISCRFRDYKALLVTSSRVSSAVASTRPLPLLYLYCLTMIGRRLIYYHVVSHPHPIQTLFIWTEFTAKSTDWRIRRCKLVSHFSARPARRIDVFIEYLYTGRHRLFTSRNKKCCDEKSYQFTSAQWTEWLAEILFSFDVRVCVCVSVRSGLVNRTSLKRLKLRTSNLTCMLPGTVRTWPLTNFSKRGVARVTWPLNLWLLNANSSKTVTATDFKFEKNVPRDSPGMTP